MWAFIGIVRAPNIHGGMKRGDGRFMFAAEKTSPQGPSPALVRPPKGRLQSKSQKPTASRWQKTYPKTKLKRWSFPKLFHYKNAKMEDVCGAVAEGASVWNQISIKRNPRRRKKRLPPCVPGAKLVPCSWRINLRQLPAALSNVCLNGLSYGSLRGYVTRNVLLCLVKQRSSRRRAHFALCAQLDFTSMVWKLRCKYCGCHATLDWMTYNITWARRLSSELFDIPDEDILTCLSAFMFILQTSIVQPAMQW